MDTLLLLASGMGALYGVCLAAYSGPHYGTTRPRLLVRVWNWVSLVVVGAVIYALVGWWVGFVLYVALKAAGGG